jgi:hypothetical protein
MTSMELEFEGRVVEWRGPAPYYFLAVPEEESADIKLAAKGMEYWGQVPVTASIGDTTFTTALFPKDGRYLLPLKAAVRRSAAIELDDVVAVALRLGRDG